MRRKRRVYPATRRVFPAAPRRVLPRCAAHGRRTGHRRLYCRHRPGSRRQSVTSRPCMQRSTEEKCRRIDHCAEMAAQRLRRDCQRKRMDADSQCCAQCCLRGRHDQPDTSPRRQGRQPAHLIDRASAGAVARQVMYEIDRKKNVSFGPTERPRRVPTSASYRPDRSFQRQE